MHEYQEIVPKKSVQYPVFWILSIECRYLSTLPGTKVWLPGTSNYSAGLFGISNTPIDDPDASERTWWKLMENIDDNLSKLIKTVPKEPAKLDGNSCQFGLKIYPGGKSLHNLSYNIPV